MFPSSIVAINTYLQYSGVSCLQKEEDFNLDGPQIFAITVLISLASISILGTLVQMFDLKTFFESRSAINNSDTSKSKGHYNDNQAALRQPDLLASQQKSPILPQPVIQGSNCASNLSRTPFWTQVIYTIDILLHFSIIKNGRKLFDTSTSRRRSSRSGTLVPGMRENSSTDSSSNQTDSTFPDDASRSTDISCVHGLRFWTITWIIFGHTMQYTEWAGFARAYQVEQNIVSFFLHPLLNATFSVDTFFLISGLLTTYVTWSITRGEYRRFNKFAFLISRYLRLTPQVMLVVLLFIVFPMVGDGPYWKGLIQKESDNCKQNWWVNALYLQAFIKQDKIVSIQPTTNRCHRLSDPLTIQYSPCKQCNLVTWWLSIEMFYHFVSIFVIVALLLSTRKGILTTLAIGGSMTGVSCYLHYVNHYPPNMLPTLLQR